MKRLPVLSGRKMIEVLRALDFEQAGQKGSHVKLKGYLAGEKRTVIVPLHEELAPGTLKSVLRQAGLTLEELKSLLKN